MGQVCEVRDLVAKLVMGQVCYWPRCPGILGWRDVRRVFASDLQVLFGDPVFECLTSRP